ncbi:hypothetical protein ASPZODRAFT_13399 [Penicilliopsis zonata CBS 506.65]|uniref:Major facilitator superfamily (MFS) profile domain-containing protein n=1 Tax=Penicilliopsis zonata CBS 506.65 TaxID=1073090 RepID=A0A1L9ST89_9EURO|nr:hypothetical protein ASPZODRAFT_13399 [Penicilliopsis zonata CBS 506.65]OJJ50313.1 hypothetical protein ASPZODRAFT_13399 [Penicilliopsis zonata CBS 506.65]
MAEESQDKAQTFHIEEGKSPVLYDETFDDPDNPLNWPYWLKIYIALLMALLGFLAQFCSSLINPGYVTMSKDLGITIEQSSYCTTVFIVFSGIAPMFVVPYGNVYGRRILFVVFSFISTLGAIVTAAAPTYGGVIVGRIINGIGQGIPLGVGVVTICDLFRQHERGLWVGLYTIGVTNGPHVAPIAGGYITQRLGWRWCFWVPAIFQGIVCLILLLTLPETLYLRGDSNRLRHRPYWGRLFFFGKVIDRPIEAEQFWRPFKLIRHATVALPALYFCTCNTFGSTLFAVTGANIGAKIFGFDTEQTGLFMGVPLSVGCMIGEASAGWVSDRLLALYARRHGGNQKPEARLFLMPLCTTLCVGTATYGLCIQNRYPWIQASVCMAISGFGLQIATTMVYTYCTDSYRSRASEVGAVLNFFKCVFAFNVGFYALPFAGKVGYTTAFSVLASINGACLFPLLILFFVGERIRIQSSDIDY